MAAKTSNDKQKNLDNLKSQLTQLQEKIGELEETPEPAEIVELYSWSSPSRIYRKKSKRWALNLALMVLIILIVLLFLKQFIVMAAVLALAFLAYVVDAVPPEEMEHQITSEGLTTAGKSYLWSELYDFWFLKKGEFSALHVSTLLNYPRRLLLLIRPEEEEEIKNLMARYLPYREHPHVSWIDRASENLSNQFHHLVGS